MTESKFTQSPSGNELVSKINGVIDDLSGKADVDLSNMNPTQNVKDTIMGWGIPDWKNRQAGVTGFNVWKTVYVDSWVSAMTTTTQLNRTLFIKMKDENGNELDGCVDFNAFMRAQQYNSNCANQVFTVVPKNYSYCIVIDSDQTIYACYEYPLKGAN